MNNRKDSMGRHRPLKTRMPNAIEDAAKRADKAPERSTGVVTMPGSVRSSPNAEEQMQRNLILQSIAIMEHTLGVEFIAFFYESRDNEGISVSGNINQRMTKCGCNNCSRSLEHVRKMVEQELKPEAKTI